MQAYKWKYFEHSVEKELFWTKLIFKTKEQGRDFMISFEGMSENFKEVYPSAWCIIDCTEYFYHRPSSLIVQSKVSFIQAKSTMLQCSNSSSKFY